MRPGSTHTNRLTGLVLTGLLCIGLQSGCAVLTQSQVDEVAAFASAVEDYGTLPGEPILLYGQVASADRMLMLSARRFADAEASEKAWESIKKAIEVEQAFEHVSSQVDQALSVLSTYSELLTTLSSDDFTDALDKTAADLGKSLDKGVKRYNETFRKPEQREELKRVGSIVAQFVRAGGGLFIRYRQAELLKHYVTQVDPLVAALTNDVKELITEAVKPRLATLEDRLKSNIQTIATRSGKVPLAEITMTVEALKKLDTAVKLCDSAASAAEKYAEAHAKLTTALSERRDLKDRIEEIRAVADEIKAARKLK